MLWLAAFFMEELMTEHDEDVLRAAEHLVEESPKGTIIEMDLSVGSFKIKV